MKREVLLRALVASSILSASLVTPWEVELGVSAIAS
jgi:hypothetical protein